MIEFRDISKVFKDRVVINKVSGKFDQGKVSLIIGASGEGKSVLLKCILGLLGVESGAVFFDGRDFFNGTSELKTQIRKEIGMLFQGGALFDSLNTEENVMFPLDMFTDLSVKQKLERVNFCLERVGLKGANKKMTSELSGGMKKRAGIARAIVNNPKYLFCDEPNSGLDPRTGIMIDELIKEITCEYNMTTIVVTHDTNSIVSIGDYIFFLERGQKSWEGDSEGIFHIQNESLRNFLFSGKLAQMAINNQKI
jgi:phospholipid/cholesterol/gamma-HCH transport system ATP-binding protein